MVQNFTACEKFQINLLPSMYGIEFVVALTGNLFALWLLVVRKRMSWHTGVILSCNLAVSDLLYILTLPLLIAYYWLGKEWRFGSATCLMERFLFTCNLYVSIFFIMAISVNRCVAIKWPFFTRSHMKPAHVRKASVAIWIVVTAISCPVFKFSGVCRSVHTGNLLCVSFCEHNPGDARSHFIYKVFLAAFGCLLPFLVTVISYCVVSWVVWKNRSVTAAEKRKVALLVLSVLLMYGVSFVPYHVFQIYHLYLRIYYPDGSNCVVYNIYQVSKGLATLNMCIHPVLYMALLDNVRVACCGRSTEENRGNDVAMRS